jgi:hypothetical protein
MLVGETTNDRNYMSSIGAAFGSRIERSALVMEIN